MSTSLLYHAFTRGCLRRTDDQDGQVIFTAHQQPETCRSPAPHWIATRASAPAPVDVDTDSIRMSRIFLGHVDNNQPGILPKSTAA